MDNTFTLCMIVKDEEKVIKRCIDSVKKALGNKFSYWVIADTGSTDKTRQIIKEELKDIPGELLEHKWESFGVNRTKVFDAAYRRSDWNILMDADMIIEGQVYLEGITADALNCFVRSDNMVWRLPLISSAQMKFSYKGAAHEYLDCVEPYTMHNYDEIIFDHFSDGHSSGSAQRNLDLLLAQDEYSARDYFYIGQSYGELGMKDKAVESYLKHIEVADFVEESFISRYRIGCLRRDVGLLLEAWNFRPWRIEPLYEAVLLLREKEMFLAATKVAEMGLGAAYPSQDALFIQKDVYDYGLLYHYSICLDYVDRPKAIRAFKEILGTPGIPEYVRSATEANLKLATSG